jgi:Fe2+ transport system protein B
VERTNRVRRSTSDRIDRIVLNRALGIAVAVLTGLVMRAQGAARGTAAAARQQA